MAQEPQHEASAAANQQTSGGFTREIVDGAPALVRRNGPVTAVWREVEWTDAQKERFARFMLKVATSEDQSER